jgi:hypothetical protein
MYFYQQLTVILISAPLKFVDKLKEPRPSVTFVLFAKLQISSSEHRFRHISKAANPRR